MEDITAPGIPRPFNRALYAPTLKAEYYQGDTFNNGAQLQPARAAIQAHNNVSKATAVLAGFMQGNEVAVGGESDIVGVLGISANGTGVVCKSSNGSALYASSGSTSAHSVSVHQDNPASGMAALHVRHEGGGTAAIFEGNVFVTKDLILQNADIAEDFQIADVSAEPGCVMIFNKEGLLMPCVTPYDKKVVGVISGAGSYAPGMILDKQPNSDNRKPVALLGKVYCKVDADLGSIEIGDMLTTSSTHGHAMKADDPIRAYGTVIGKALKPLASGQALIPILVNLK